MQLETPLILTFDKFAKGDYDEGERNLYIVWRRQQCLYVGVSRANIWNRWFSRGIQSHIFNVGGHWRVDYSSTMGRVIIRNLPASLSWKIELRHITQDLREAEEKLIYQLRPLFNTMHGPAKTQREIRLSNLLEYGESAHIANMGTAKVKAA